MLLLQDRFGEKKREKVLPIASPRLHTKGMLLGEPVLASVQTMLWKVSEFTAGASRAPRTQKSVPILSPSRVKEKLNYTY